MDFNGRQKRWLKDLCNISNREIILLDEFKKDKLTWEEFWKANLLQVAASYLHCKCLFIELSNRPKGTTKDQMEKMAVILARVNLIEMSIKKELVY